MKRCLVAVFTSVGILCGTAAAQNDPVPKPPELSGTSAGVKSQVGVGSGTAYATAGVVELGGFVNFTFAEDYTEMGASPTVGYFFADNFQASLLANYNYSRIEPDVGSDIESNSGSLIAEPSVHVPITNSSFWFAGLGVGGLFQKGEKPGIAIAPRLGFQNLVGRSGMITLAVQTVFGMNESEVQSARGTVLTVEQATQASFGYTVLL